MKYIENNCSIELSVRELCSRAYAAGDIDSRFHTSLDAYTAGAEIHRRIQREAGAHYSAEVSLINTVSFGGIYYTVSGRADGIIKDISGYTVDEIKSVRAFDFYAPPKDIFVAQMKCYAYFLAVREELSVIRGRITYVNSDNGKIKYYDYKYTTEELHSWYLCVISKVSRAAAFLKYRCEEALPSAKNVAFPYEELREGQELTIREGYSAMRKGKRLFACAPTGTGKTMSALYPAVRALGGGYADRIFYLTAKASTRREGYRAAGKLFEAGARLKTVVLTAKEQICACSARSPGGKSDLCNPIDCEFARGYYERAEDAIFDLLSRQNGFTRKVIFDTAMKYRVCPYELSLDLSEYCDIIICDYNYVFDPSVYLRRYFSDGGERGRYIFLIDEAHNLADRARDMYSANIRRSAFEKIYAAIDPSESELDMLFEKMIMLLRGLRRLCADNLTRNAEGEERGFYMSSSLPQKLIEEFEDFRKKAEAWLRKNKEHSLSSAVQNLNSDIRRFLTICECFDDKFLFYTEISGGDTLIKVYCLDPSRVMDIAQNRANSTVLFSATLTPMDYYKDVLGGGAEAKSLSLSSPFDSSNLCVAVADYLSVRYEDRRQNIPAYVSAIAAAVSAKAGNYIVYFPSYEVLDAVAASFKAAYPKVELLIQHRNMTQKDRESFIESFKDDTGKLRVGFCVLGGSFAEGMDLPGSRLIGTVIFGVGLPGISNERNIIRDYFETRNGCGYDYAYTFPGMNNVLQAAGRVIRRDEDRGIIVLVDSRYTEKGYEKLFPEHWKGVQYAGNAPSLAEITRRFWDKS